MPTLKRIKTKYAGVVYLEVPIGNEKIERIFYIRYRKGDKQIEEKAGRQFKDNMTAAKASLIRAERIRGKQPTNKERREIKKAEAGGWTVSRLWEFYKESKGMKNPFSDESRFQKYLKPVLGNKELINISPLDVDRIRISLSKKLKPQTVKHCLALLKRISNFAIDKRLCPGIAFKFPKIKFSNLKTEDLTNEQLLALLKTIEEDTHPLAGPLMKLALFTGMRKTEMFKLRWVDINFEKDFIRLIAPKGGIDQTIPLNPEAKKIFNQLPRDSEYIFPGRNGKQRVDIWDYVNRIKIKAGLPKDFRPLHGLRHVYASMLASSGKVDLYTLSRLLTHKSPIMTKRYAHLRDETLRKASNLAGELVNKIAMGE